MEYGHAFVRIVVNVILRHSTVDWGVATGNPWNMPLLKIVTVVPTFSKTAICKSAESRSNLDKFGQNGCYVDEDSKAYRE